MLDHCTYDRIKLLHELSRLLWFIEKHGKPNAKEEGDQQLFDNLEKLAQDLEKNVAQLKDDLHL